MTVAATAYFLAAERTTSARIALWITAQRTTWWMKAASTAWCDRNKHGT